MPCAFVVPASSTRVRLARSFVEMQLAMALGALVCMVVGGAIRSATGSEIYRPGMPLYSVGDLIFLTTPVMGLQKRRRRAAWKRGAPDDPGFRFRASTRMPAARP